MFKRKKIIYKNIKFLKFLFNYFIPKSKKYNLPSSSFLLEDDFINIEYKDEKFIKK